MQILDHSLMGVRAVVRRIPVQGHHEDEATLPAGVPVGTYPDFGVVIR
jgi:hypothetical protein